MLDAIKEKLESRGWEIVEVRNIRYLWVAEIWKACSVWSPRGLVLYFSFTVDPHDGSHEFDKISWLHASPEPPVDWALEPGDSKIEMKTAWLEHSSTVLGRNQDKYFDKFLDGLDAWRDDSAKSESV